MILNFLIIIYFHIFMTFMTFSLRIDFNLRKSRELTHFVSAALVLVHTLKTMKAPFFFCFLWKDARSWFNSAPKSSRVLFLCESTQLRLYIRYKLTLIVWRRFCSHHFSFVAEVLGCFVWVFFSHVLLRKSLWPFFWEGTVVGTEYKNKF